MLNGKTRKRRRKSVVKIAILDDDLNFTKFLRDKIRHCCAKRDWEMECKLYSSPKLLLASDLSKTQVIFLDIDMPELDGLEVARQIRKKHPNTILIFVTGWLKYAPAGYQVNALRYLLKSQLDLELEPCMDAIQEKLFENKDTVLIPQKDLTVEIAVRDILYFEGTSKRTVLLHTIDTREKPLECFGKLSEYDSSMREKGFLRIHKSFLVNMYYIDKISNYTAKLRNGTELKVSEKNYKQICADYVMWKGAHL